MIIGLPDALGRIQAWFMDYIVPGKILSVDSYKSLSVASVCTENGFAELGIKPAALRAMLPNYLTDGRRQLRLSSYRRHARR
jgi:hypothetical protein